MRKLISLAAVLTLALMPISPVLAETIPSGSFGKTIYHNGTDWVASSLLYNNGSKIGIGTTSTEFKLTLDNDGGIIAKGVLGSGDTLTTSGAGTRMIWYPRKAAFRAGYVDSNQWDDAKVGIYSSALGYNGVASGSRSAVIGGSDNTAGGEDSAIVSGYDNTANGYFSAVVGGSSNHAVNYYSSVLGGYQNESSGFYSAVVGGANNIASGNYSVAAGYFTGASASNAFALGRNITVGGASSFGVNVSSEPVSLSQANTIALMGGPVGVGTVDPVSKLEVNGDSGYSQLRLTKSFTPNNTADTRGNVGDVAWDDNYMYIKTNAGWKRTAMETFGVPVMSNSADVAPASPAKSNAAAAKPATTVKKINAAVKTAPVKSTTVSKPVSTTAKPAIKTTTVKPATIIKPATTTLKVLPTI